LLQDFALSLEQHAFFALAFSAVHAFFESPFFAQHAFFASPFLHVFLSCLQSFLSQSLSSH
jgi:hypothetical protein